MRNHLHARSLLSRPRRHGFQKISPVVWLENDFGILELSNGPTLAFKDMAMQYLGSLFEFVLARKETRLNILGATSGDTGSAAEYAMKGREGIQVFMLSPAGRMSKFQKAQMYSCRIRTFSILPSKAVLMMLRISSKPYPAT